MNAAFAPSSARRYENNWTRFVTYVQKLDRKKRYMPASPNTVIAFVQHLKNEGKAPNTIRSFLSAISERHKACRYPDPTNDYLVAKTVKGVAHTCPHVDQRQPLSTRDVSITIKSVPTSRCSSYTVILLRAMFSLMFFGFLRIGEVTAHTIFLCPNVALNPLIYVWFSCHTSTVLAAPSPWTFSPQAKQLALTVGW